MLKFDTINVQVRITQENDLNLLIERQEFEGMNSYAYTGVAVLHSTIKELEL